MNSHQQSQENSEVDSSAESAQSSETFSGKKSAVISIIGRPSSGKSTLLNYLCGHKISITSPVPQTTRNAIRGIFNDPRGQLLFLDTPGFHDSDRKLNLQLKEIAIGSLDDTDIVLYVVDTVRELGKEELGIISALQKYSGPVLAALNKTDLPASAPETVRREIMERLPEAQFFSVSALTGAGTEELLDALFSAAPEGEPFYPEEYYTDQPPEFRIAEIIREKAMNRVSQEIPHAIYVEVADIEIDEEKNTMWIRSFINVERETQKGILVGRGGSGIKAVRKNSQKDLRAIFGYAVQLDLRVKVQKKWRKNDAILSKLIF